MTIPFDQIGPGQVGRLAYQVIGKDGPILNPANIRYLDPSEAGISATDTDMSYLAGLSGLTLAASAASAGLSAATLRECRQIKIGIARIEARLDLISDRLSGIESRVERIDIKVAESHLREAVKHLVGQAVGHDNIDLIELSRLTKDLDTFRESLEGPLLFGFSINLSSDVRDLLEEILTLLQSLRFSIVLAHNRSVEGDPLSTLGFHPICDYLPCSIEALLDFTVAIGRDDNVFHSFAETLGKEVVENFMFANEEEDEKFKEFCYDNYFHPQNEALMTTASSAAAMLLNMSASTSLPDLNYDDDEVRDELAGLVKSWFLESDGALLFRLSHELEGIGEGYEKAFYPAIESNTSLTDRPSTPDAPVSLNFRHTKEPITG